MQEINLKNSAKKKGKKGEIEEYNFKGMIEGKVVTITMALVTIYVLIGVRKLTTG